MKILITGANGFIGDHLCRFLSKESYEVRRSVRVHDGLPNTVVLTESSPKTVLASACAGIDCVIHLAAIAHTVIKSNRESNNHYQIVNVDFTRQLAEVAQEVGVSRFVFVSTVNVCYEMIKGEVLCENHVNDSVNHYSFSKLMAEQELRSLEKRTGFDIVIVRPPLIYGPNVRSNFLLLLLFLYRGLPLPISWVTSRRSFMYIENFTSSLVACAIHPRAAGESFFVCDENSVTLPQIAADLSRSMCKRLVIFPIPKSILVFIFFMIGRRFQINSLINPFEVDSSKIRDRLGWFPPYSYEHGIKATTDWYLGKYQRRNLTIKHDRTQVARKIKICQLCAVDFTMQHLLLPLIEAMLEKGWMVTLVCSDGTFLKNLRSQGYDTRVISISRNFFSLYSHIRAIWDLYWLFRDQRFDVLHVHTPIAAVLGRIAGLMAGIPLIIYTAHGFYFHDEMSWWKRKIFIFLEQLSGLKTDYIFTQSSEDARTAITERIINPEKIMAIGNGVNTGSFVPDCAKRALRRFALQIPNEAFVIGVVARLVKEKGLEELLEAAIKLGSHYPHVNLLLVGERLSSDHSLSIKKKIRHAQATLGNRLHIVGYRSDVAAFLEAMDLFCLPSYREGMPRSIIEAMMMELPVVATNIRGVREEVVQGETGLLVPTRDVVALTQAIETLIIDPERCKKMGQAGRLRALKLYDEKFVVTKQIEVIRKLIETI